MNLLIFSWILIILASISQIIGGYLDMYDKRRICLNKLCISKWHLWKDSIFLLLIAIAINVVSRR